MKKVTLERFNEMCRLDAKIGLLIFKYAVKMFGEKKADEIIEMLGGGGILLYFVTHRELQKMYKKVKIKRSKK